MLLSTSESLGITVTPRTFLIQSENMGDRELLCENLWFSTESRSEDSAEWAVLLGPSLLKPTLTKIGQILGLLTPTQQLGTPCKI